MRISDWSSDVCSSDLIDFDLGTFTYANIARARASGVEIGIALRPVDAFTVGANYTYTRARNRPPGANFAHALARRPRETVTLSAAYRFPFALSQIGRTSWRERGWQCVEIRVVAVSLQKSNENNMQA